MRFKFAGINNLSDPASIDCLNGKSSQYGQCVDVCNFDIDDEYNLLSRSGTLLLNAGNYGSAFSTNQGVVYGVYNGLLTKIYPELSSLIGSDSCVVGNNCYFVMVNDIVVFSDGFKIGTIINDVVSEITQDIQNLPVSSTERETYIQATYPMGGISGTFTIKTLPGKYLEFHAGALYLAVDNVLYCTKTFDVEHMNIRYNVIAGFPDNITMVKSVETGLFIGTTKGVYFLQGKGFAVEDDKIIGGFTQRQVSTFAALPGSAVSVDVGLIPILQSYGAAVLWSSPLGIFVGYADGVVNNLSANKIELLQMNQPLPDVTAAIVRKNRGIKQYILCLNKTAWVLNLNTLSHSRYTNFDVTSMFSYNLTNYGICIYGLCRLDGDIDFTDFELENTNNPKKINTFVTTPAVDFGNRNAKHLESVYLQARNSSTIQLEYIVDEENTYNEDLIWDDGKEGVHTLRGNPPKGMRGVLWQFRVSNVDGSALNLLNAEVEINKSKTRSR